MSCLPQTQPTVFLRIKTIKATNAVQMLYSFSSSKLHHTSGQWCIVTSNFLLFNIIIMYCLSHNTINSLHKKPTISTPPALMQFICRHSITDIIHLLYKQLSRSRSPKMCCIHLVIEKNHAHCTTRLARVARQLCMYVCMRLRMQLFLPHAQMFARVTSLRRSRLLLPAYE